MILAKTSELSSQIDNGEKVRLTFHHHNKPITKFLNSLFIKVLSKHNIVFLQSTIETILREMIVNAVKANSKRVYFKKLDLDINNDDHYSIGMENFKKYITSDNKNLISELKKNNYKVEINIEKDSSGLHIIIKNNSPIIQHELDRINNRINKAKHYSNFTDVYSEINDDIEGEGLGILLTILFLKNSGIGENSFKITSNDKITKTSLTIPFKLKPIEITNSIQTQILEEINELPTFPESIIELQDMCKEPGVSIKQIANTIQMDPSLTASVLKLSNSAGFITSTRTENLFDAIKIIGLKNLNTILITSSTRKIMDQKYTHFSQIWNHCNKTAFYSKYIAQKYGLKQIIDKISLAGLLHDLGKIVLLSADTKLSEWLSDITKRREIKTSTIIEEVSIGISHSTIGEIIAKKWMLPDYLIASIGYHHSPLTAPEKFKDLVYTVYLANVLCNIENREFDYYYTEDDVLTRFNIKNEKDFNKLHQEIKNTYY